MLTRVTYVLTFSIIFKNHIKTRTEITGSREPLVVNIYKKKQWYDIVITFFKLGDLRV